MTKLNGWRIGAVFAFCALTGIGAAGQTFTTLLNFDYTNGSNPYYVSLVQGKDGAFYGTTSDGGAYGSGTLFRVTPSGQLSTVYNFCAPPSCAGGRDPQGSLLLGLDGNLYGTTFQGGNSQCFLGCGTVFKVTPKGALITIYSFCSQSNCNDGSYPAAGLLQGIDGNFYGMTTFGGTYGHGTIFKLNSVGVATVLYTFCSQTDCPDGDLPSFGLMQASDGNFYGTASQGGRGTCDNGCGTIFRITPKGKFTVLHRFNLTDGAYPVGTLTQGADGLYGVASEGGNDDCSSYIGCGTVFRITTHGVMTILHAFNLTDGAIPNATLALGTDGKFYGTTYVGGDLTCFPVGCGTLFSITAQGTLATLHIFEGTDGMFLYDGLMQSTTGTFYGLSNQGGDLTCAPPYGCGSIFSLGMVLVHL